MLDIKFIRENVEVVKENCKNRNVGCDVDRLLALDERRRELLHIIEDLKAQKNRLNDEIKKASNEERPAIIERGKLVKDELAKREPELEEVEKEFRAIMLQVPNVTHPDSPIGRDDGENKEIERYGKNPIFDFEPKTHDRLMEELDLVDFERARKVTGSKFYYFKNEGALLELALINYAMDFLVKEGFTPVTTPDLARNEVLEGIGFNPRGEETQVYSVEGTDLSLVGTAEITMGGYHMNEVLKEAELPKKYVALSHCFRTEAGSYGRHSAGLYRVHQFSKVEMFIHCAPEQSEEMHQYLKELEVRIFDGLGIPFRVVDICTGDLGGPAYRKYDLEAFMVSKLPDGYRHEGGEIPQDILAKSWGEITSTSNTTDYQSRRLNIKMERGDGTKEYLHMLNGTAMTTSRTPLAIVENYQQADGSIIIPEALRKYMPGNLERISRK